MANFVGRWFELRYGFTPDAIFGTELVLEDGKVVGVVEDSVICPLDKRVSIEHEHPSENPERLENEIIILGDSREDLMVVEKYTKSFGFTDEDRGFDITLGKGGSMKDIVF